MPYHIHAPQGVRKPTVWGHEGTLGTLLFASYAGSRGEGEGDRCPYHDVQ